MNIKDKYIEIKENMSKECTLEERYDRKNNIFDYVRILLAIFVIIAHSYPIFFGIGFSDPITRKILCTESLGGISVICFFLLSGFMITQSIMHSKNSVQFFMKRLIRIFPALIVMLLLTIFVLGPLVYNGSIVEYFKNSSVWRYFIDNVNLFGNTAYNIEGVFTNNPYPSAINGSLWSLKHEFIAYIILVILATLGITKNRKAMLSLTGISVIVYVLNIKFASIFNCLNNIGVVMEIAQFVKLIMYFFIGSSIYLYKDKIKMNFKYFVLAVLILLTGIALNSTKYALIITIPYILMYVGTVKIKKDILKKIGDFSYALYIYAFPIQQLLVYYLKDKINIWVYMLLSIALTGIISIVTTLLIDNNVKKIKERTLKKQEA